MSFAEYQQLLGYKSTKKPTDNVKSFPKLRQQAAVDWKALDKVTPVKDQGSCGSCWAFSSVGPLESAYAIESGKTGADLVRFSEQQLVDCSAS